MNIDPEKVLAALDRRFSQVWAKAISLEERSRLASSIITRLYDDFYHLHLAIPQEAKRAFETKDWQRSLELSRLRIDAFGSYLTIALTWFQQHVDPAERNEQLWEAVYRFHLQKIAGSYQGDIAYAFLSSVRRGLTDDRWRVVDYSYARATGARRPAAKDRPQILMEQAFEGPCAQSHLLKILQIPQLNCPFRDISACASAAATRINERLRISQDTSCTIQMIDGGFYRNRGAYLVGNISHNQENTPFAIALLHDLNGVYIDAVVFESNRLHHLFSSTLANFHCTNANFHEVVDFLFEMMPKRPRGLHYSTIGYNHVGKLAVLRQIEQSISTNEACLDYALGPRGSVAIGFTSDDLGYVLKVVRDKPTDQYKWGEFPGIDHVLEKYRQVHEINRAGSMLDNVIYENVALPERAFSPELRAELLEAAASNVSIQDGQLIFRHLIVQMKMMPLPEFLDRADEENALEAISSLGRCIKNNAAANIFNRDLDGRNYGVGPTLRVHLFDYDAVETLTNIKVRTNAGREDGEEDVPDWFFEDGIVFLPEEIELHLRLKDKRWRQAFREEHGDLLTVDFWLARQAELQSQQVPRVSTYPEYCRLTNVISALAGRHC